jgi:hypothetical protein
MNLSLAEFSYSIGDKLDSLIDIKDYSLHDTVLKPKLKILEKKYGVSADVILKLLKGKHFGKKEDTVVYKLDKEIKTSFLSMADYKKIFKYTGFKRSGLNSNLLNLQYDENGVLVSSKQTSESKLFPTIINTLTGLTSVASALIMGPTAADAVAIKKDTGIVKINLQYASELDKSIDAYSKMIAGNFYTDKHFEERKKKAEEDVAKAFADLFYSKEVKLIPLQITFIIPEGDKNVPATDAEKVFKLFYYDKATQEIVLNKELKDYLLVTPSDRFRFESKLDKTVNIRLSAVEKQYDKAGSLSELIDLPEGRKTAVYNIPKSERFRLEKPGSKESYIDTTIKVPQHGGIGYYALKLSSLELTYDANGELKSIAAEKKSATDTNVSSGAGALKEIVTLAKGKSEIDELTEKATILELEKKIRDLEKDPDQ